MRRSRVVSAIAVVCLGVTGCASDSNGSADAPTPAASDSPSTGDATSAEASEAETVRMGFILSLGGPAEVYGNLYREGMEVAIAMGEADLFDGRYTIEAEYGNDETDAARSASLVSDLAADSSIVALAGGVLQNGLQAMIPAADEAEVPLAGSTGTDASFYEGAMWAWGPLPNNADQGKALFETVKDQGGSRVALLHDDRSYGLGTTEAFEAAAGDDGGVEIVCNETLAADAQTSEPQLLACSDSEPDTIVAFVINPLSSILLKDVARLGLEAQLYGGLGFSDAAVVEAAGEDAEGVIVQALVNPDAPSTATQEEFLAVFNEMHGKDPSSINAFGFDSAWMLMHALAAADAPTRQDINEAMSTLAWEGAMGQYEVREDHTAFVGGLQSARVEDGVLVPVSP